MGWGHLMHAIRVNRERASNSYPFRQGREGEGGEKKKKVSSWNEEWCSDHTMSKGSGRATNELVGNFGEMPIRNQKRLVKP